MKEKPVVNIHFSNGVGNNLFQFIYAWLVTEKRGWQLSHPALPVFGLKENKIPFIKGYPTEKFIGSSKNPIDYTIPFRAKPHNYDMKVYPEDFTLYLNEIDNIRESFPAPADINENDLALHLRLGDRLVMKGCFKGGSLIPAEEYAKGIDSFKFDRLHIVTDSMLWREITPRDVQKMSFHRNVKHEDRIDPKISADYFNSLFNALNKYDPIVRLGNSVESDFDYMRRFKKIMFAHGTLSWWAAAIGNAEEVACYSKWRGGKDINLGWTPFPGWCQWGPLTAPARGIKQWHLKRIAKKYDLTQFVETGTRGGTTLLNLKDDFNKMWSVEIIPEAYEKICKRLNGYKHINLFLGDSAIVIKDILFQITEPCLFWLDAHDGEHSTPIMDEVEAILKSDIPRPYVLIMDDYRYFVEKEPYPTPEEMTELVNRLAPDARIDPKYDSFRVFMEK